MKKTFTLLILSALVSTPCYADAPSMPTKRRPVHSRGGEDCTKKQGVPAQIKCLNEEKDRIEGRIDTLPGGGTVLPVGSILAWLPAKADAAPPPGWLDCDGAAGRPNLQGGIYLQGVAKSDAALGKPTAPGDLSFSGTTSDATPTQPYGRYNWGSPAGENPIATGEDHRHQFSGSISRASLNPASLPVRFICRVQ